VEVEIGGSEDVLMGGRIGRVAVVDVETVGNDHDGPNGFSAGFFSSCTDGVDDGAPNDRPGEKAGALGLRALAGGFCAEAAEMPIAGGVALLFSTLLGSPDGALCEAEKVEDDDSTAPVAGVGDVDRVDLANGDPKVDAALL
jgi:hypothetical protein